MEEVNEPIMEYNVLDLNKTYTYDDYMRWLFKERVELIKGKVVKMSPAPNNAHQALQFNLNGLLYNHFNKKMCKVFPAPFDVILPIASAKKDTTIVQPDLTILCDSTKLDGHGCNGVPDLVMEILSPENSKHDLHTKFNLYEESGVKEYWIVDPQNRNVLVYSLRDIQFIGLQPFTEGSIVESVLFSDLKIAVEDIFESV